MQGWICLYRELGLYQIEENSFWYTDKPIFCSFSKKQIEYGYIISRKDDIVGICEPKYFIDTLSCKLFSFGEPILICAVVSSAMPTKKSVKRERSKMTLQLRYKILKRDNFKCISCGVPASECELHIDHIIPVSKGGKTEENNLQTLCLNCNLGKSDEH